MVNQKATVIIPQQMVNKAVTVRVINADGKVILSRQQSSYTNTISIGFPEAAAKGMVMVQLFTAGKLVYKEKVILQ